MDENEVRSEPRVPGGSWEGRVWMADNFDDSLEELFLEGDVIPPEDPPQSDSPDAPPQST
jgi:hypothetical protein